jgi:uncharacterized damage-inducible protein DinB
MSIRAALLPEFDLEMANTRRVLERVPAAQLDWRPHEKSYTLRDLATHLSHLPHWATATLELDALDLAATPPNAAVDSVEQALAIFDQKIVEARAAIEAADDARMMSRWSLLMGGQEIFSMPKAAVLRSFVLNHMIHHRGQMTVYLRLCEVPLPPLYGPSADEAN